MMMLMMMMMMMAIVLTMNMMVLVKMMMVKMMMRTSACGRSTPDQRRCLQHRSGWFFLKARVVIAIIIIFALSSPSQKQDFQCAFVFFSKQERFFVGIFCPQIFPK